MRSRDSTTHLIPWVTYGIVFITCFLMASASHAEQRVLVRFDAAGHEMVKHIRLPVSTVAINALRHRHLRGGVAGFKQVQRGDGALVQWFDLNGDVIEEDVIRHPGIVHVPRIAAGQFQPPGDSRNSERAAGFYLLSGPDAAMRVEVLLDGIGDSTERWVFDLP